MSTVLIAAALGALFLFGLRPGIDFAGGTLLEVKFEQTDVTADKVRLALAKADKAKVVPDFFTNAVVQPAGDGFVIRSQFMEEVVHTAVAETFQQELGQFEELRFQTIGPVVGQSMKKKAVYAVGMAIVFIILFIAYAFRSVPAAVSSWKFGLAAVAALVHDVIITCGVFAVLGFLFSVEIDLLFITALLTIMGFSVHDTIVVFDRLRENLARSKGTKTIAVAANDALNETLARSINTSLTTLITLTFLLVLGGESIRWFVAAMVVGMVAGTYSSIFFATPLLVSWSRKK